MRRTEFDILQFINDLGRLYLVPFNSSVSVRIRECGMRVNPVAMTLVVSLVGVQAAYAQNTDITSQAFMRAALAVMTFDYYATKCQHGGGFSPSQAAKVGYGQS